MIVYHGAQTDNFIPQKFKHSRYGIPVLFFTDNKLLASYFSKDANLYIASINANKVIDFGGEFSHSRNFRNLIYKLFNSGPDVVEIKNVYDRPNDDFPLEKSSILVVFNFDQILDLKRCTL